MTQKIRSYVFFPAVALLTGGVAGWLIRDSFESFEQINKPVFTPPAAVFLIIWSVLYLLMGIGAARVAQNQSPQRENALTLFAAQLVINFFWPILFFRLNAYTLGAIWIVLLFILAAAMTWTFAQIDRIAGWLQSPYLLWLIFAGILNVAILVLN